MIQSPFHQTRSPAVFCTVPTTDILRTARKIRNRIMQTVSSRGAGSYLYIDGARQAYLVSEDATCAQQWVRERFAWLVGFYGGVGLRVESLTPDAEGLVEDITEHLTGLADESGAAA